MRTSSLGLLAIAGGFAAAQDISRCGSDNPPSELLRPIARVQEQPLDSPAAESYVVNTYVHVITTTAKEGQYPQSMIDEQITVLNSTYAASGFSFNTVNTDYSVNNTWATCNSAGSQCELDYKSALRKGEYADLNLYYLSDLGGLVGLLGYAEFPESTVTNDIFIRDGAVNRAGTLPGAETERYNMGITTVHEVGHWLGLFHTFQGFSCSGDGDLVADTPQQLDLTPGCPASADTCPDSPGSDPIHNYMDYTDD
ncbi:hypothetical protein B9Z65_3455 [Elsinoe australis]|uniref:Peptidase M43 pregnancy-associated plasma-A domain-containing protein n=1 Tax=Elsinoe australis TaxID=40998 RepID=A0A2P8A1M1_9PEZI|nr:hypothetical protein B9Z65_3455 [Elsinoe australis]